MFFIRNTHAVSAVNVEQPVFPLFVSDSFFVRSAAVKDGERRGAGNDSQTGGEHPEEQGPR